MKAPLSVRSMWLWRVFWIYFALTFVMPTLASLFVPLPRVQVDGQTFWIVVALTLGLWLGLLVAYAVSRLNDAWDEEARERRAAQRSTAS